MQNESSVHTKWVHSGKQTEYIHSAKWIIWANKVSILEHSENQIKGVYPIIQQNGEKTKEIKEKIRQKCMVNFNYQSSFGGNHESII